jgi:hypothetical protein
MGEMNLQDVVPSLEGVDAMKLANSESFKQIGPTIKSLRGFRHNHN